MSTIAQKIASFKTAQDSVKTALENRGITMPTAFASWSTTIASNRDKFVSMDWDGSITSVSPKSGSTSIRKYVFAGCSNLTSFTVPYTVITIDSNAFTYSSLTAVTFTGRTKADVKGSSAVIAGYPWGLANNAVITCTDGTITVGA